MPIFHHLQSRTAARPVVRTGHVHLERAATLAFGVAVVTGKDGAASGPVGVTAAAYTQNVTQTSTDHGTVTTTRADGRVTVDTVALAYPLSVSYTYDNASNTQTSTVTQAITSDVVRQLGGKQFYASSFANTVQANSQLVIDSTGAAKRGPQQGGQQVRYTDTLGSCYDRQIATASNALTTATDAATCSGGNVLNWLSPSDGSPAQGVLSQITPE